MVGLYEERRPVAEEEGGERALRPTRMAKSQKFKDMLREVAVEAITLRGPMTGRQILDYAIDNHKGAVRWVPAKNAVYGILGSDSERRFTCTDRNKQKIWRLRD